MIFITETARAGPSRAQGEPAGNEQYVLCTASRVEVFQVANGKSLEGQIISEIEEIGGVRCTSVKRNGDTFEVRVVMANMDFDPFNAVVHKELELYARYPRFTFHFDINPLAAVEESSIIDAA